MQITKRDLVVTNKFVYLVGRELIKKGPQKGQVEEVIKRKLEYQMITRVSLRYLPAGEDNSVVEYTAL